ncbi:MAG TPA: hypothetical protein DCS11_04630 [Syntrophus sp. (in: bacteria)]|jgi:hypothetical protein|nr:hypothetical protein [Syntrophus sp. (in: bacteria)]
MARTKYTFEKRQKELAKRRKKEEKAARRAESRRPAGDETGAGTVGEAPDSAAEASNSGADAPTPDPA